MLIKVSLLLRGVNNAARVMALLLAAATRDKEWNTEWPRAAGLGTATADAPMGNGE